MRIGCKIEGRWMIGESAFIENVEKRKDGGSKLEHWTPKATGWRAEIEG